MHRGPPMLLLWRFEVSVDQSFGLHVVQVGHAVRALQAPAHGVGGRVVRQRVSAVQDWNTTTKLNFFPQ